MTWRVSTHWIKAHNTLLDWKKSYQCQSFMQRCHWQSPATRLLNSIWYSQLWPTLLTHTFMIEWMNVAEPQWRYRATALKILQQGMKTQSTTAYFSFFLSSSFSLCHHDKHLCRHLPSHRRCRYLASCHHWALCSSITLHYNAGDHPLHLRARIHHLWQGQQHLHWYRWYLPSNWHRYTHSCFCVWC